MSEEEKSCPIAYAILVHHKFHQFAQLLSAVYAPQNVYCIHVDLKASEVFQTSVREMAKCFPNVLLSNKSEDVVYESISLLQAHINSMDTLLDSSVPWNHLINLCGQVVASESL